ncbi:MAG: alkaline phosphatase D family protein [Candidatus Eisenbacteria bacterium]
MKRRDFLRTASLFGAALAFGAGDVWASTREWRERREFFPEGVASGDPQAESVILWTRRPPVNGSTSRRLTLEIAEDEKFTRVVATTRTRLSAASDWTCRVLAAGLKPARVYWYRFTDEEGNGSRIGRTVTAPANDDPRPARFAFVSCQDANTGAQNAYRRMIYEDERAPENERLGFVLHLGDFIYEMVWYPEDRKQGYYDRTIYDVVRYPGGEKISDFHVPITVDDYRAVYRGYLHDPEIQDARARWPFVCIWDNHEYSWQGYQGMQVFGGKTRPAQTRKVAANQAWWEFQPARVEKPSGPSLETFDPPHVEDAPVTTYDEHGLGQEPNNLTAIASLKAYRSTRYGANFDLFITDLHSFRSPDATDVPEGDQFYDKAFPYFVPEEVIEILDAGRTYDGGHPPATIRFAGKDIHNSRADGLPPSMLGVEQKAWFLSQLRSSRTPWKVWGNSLPTLTERTDPQNLPPGSPAWGGSGYASLGGGDWSNLVTERNEIFDAVRDAGITGFTIVAGDRHAFWSGLPSRSLPPKPFEPVGLEFITGSISAPGFLESAEHRLRKDVPLRGMYLADTPGAAKPEPTVNMMIRHGVRSALEYASSRDIAKARALSNPDSSPHLTFVDTGGHGYATVRVTPDTLETEFVCIERPIVRNTAPDGGPLRYRVLHRANLWKAGERPSMEVKVIEGAADLSI